LLATPLRALADSPPLAVTTSAELAPLTDEQRRIVESIPDEHTPLPRRHYFRSNEWYQGLLRAPLAGRGGVLVGVGSDQNYTMAALAGSELLLLVDYDPRIPWVHRIYDVLVRASETPDALIQRFADESEQDTRALLEQGLASDPHAVAIVKHFRKHRVLWHKYLLHVQRLSGADNVTSWLADPALYAHVRKLFLGGRVIARNGDLTADKTVRAIGDAARALHLPVRIVYFSNAEQFFLYTPGFQANMQNLPTDERSVAIRTLHHGHIPNAGPNDWHYMVHEFPDFLARMQSGYRKCFGFSADLLGDHGRAIGQSGVSVLSAAVPRSRDVLRAAKQHRKHQAPAPGPSAAVAPTAAAPVAVVAPAVAPAH
jgi:hypothetical protein